MIKTRKHFQFLVSGLAWLLWLVKLEYLLVSTDTVERNSFKLAEDKHMCSIFYKALESEAHARPVVVVM